MIRSMFNVQRLEHSSIADLLHNKNPNTREEEVSLSDGGGRPTVADASVREVRAAPVFAML